MKLKKAEKPETVLEITEDEMLHVMADVATDFIFEHDMAASSLLMLAEYTADVMTTLFKKEKENN